MVSKSDEVWPEWPQNSKGQRMVDVEVACSADELFLLLWAPNSAYVVSSIDMPITGTAAANLLFQQNLASKKARIFLVQYWRIYARSAWE